MESSRHQKVAIIIASYVIGFTTAFIAFGIGSNLVNQGNIASAPTSSFLEKKNNSLLASIAQTQDGLYLYTEDKTLLLSANQDPFATDSEISGVHYLITDVEISRDKKYVYFCEQLSRLSKICEPFVYSIENDYLVRVTVDGEELKPNIKEHNSFWTDENKLVVNNYISTISEEPWQLSSAQ